MKRNLQAILLLLLSVAFSPSVAHAGNSVPGLGDVNSDGIIDVNDVTDLIACVLGGAPGGFDAAKADTSVDGIIDVEDVIALINYVLQGAWPGESAQPVEETFTVNGVSFSMVAIEGGTFLRNAIVPHDFEVQDWEAPAFGWLTVPNYRIGKTEVTQELWQAVMGTNPSYFKGNLNRPVEQVSWNDCQEFILKLNELTGRRFRLPSEAEWEYAARGGNKSEAHPYSGNDSIALVAWYEENSYGFTHPVGMKATNELGLYDMTGNVWEWCLDWKTDEEHHQYDEYELWGQWSGTLRVRRGGCWSSPEDNCMLLTAPGSAASTSDMRLGLRLALVEDNDSQFGLSHSVIAVNVGESKSVKLFNINEECRTVGGEDNFSCTIDGDNLTVTGLHEGINTVRVSTHFVGMHVGSTVLTVIVRP